MTPLPVEPLEARQLLAYQYIDFGAGLSVTDVNATGQILVEANPDRTYYLAGPNRYAARSLGLNPALNDRNGDLDGDGMTNIQEYLLGTNPNSADSDGDALPDGWEQQYGLSLSLDDAAGDRLFVTGKLWQRLFEIKVNPR